jgi:hypothetical protein
MATLTGQTIASTYDGLLKLSDNDGLTASVKNIEDGFGVASPVNISTAVLFIKPTSDTSSTPTSGKEFEVVGNALITGDLQIDNINIDGNTISATSGVVTLSNGTIATTQSQSDNSTKVATTAYVDTLGGTFLPLAGGTMSGSIAMGSNNISGGGTATFTSFVGALTGNASTSTKIASITNSNIVQLTSSQTLTNKIIDFDNNTISNIEVDNFKASAIVIESEGIGSNDNDTTLPTSAAVKNYVDSQVDTADTLSEILAIGNTTGGTNIAVSTGDNITFADGSSAYFGDSNDLRIAHVGGNSKIQDSGTGSLVLDTNGASILLTKSDTEHLAKFLTDGAVELYNDNSKKFQTTSTGVQVTGSNLSVLAGSGATKLQFVQTDGNWKIEAGGGTNQLVIHSESLVADYVTIKGGGVVQLNDYGSGSNTGTAAYNLSVDSSGNIIETAGGVVDGSGTANDVAMWSDSNTLTDAPIAISGNNATFAGDITATSKKFISTSSSSGDYVRLYAGSGTAQWDIYGSGENLRLSENSSGGGIFQVDSGATFAGNITFGDSHFIGDDASDNLLIQSSANENIIIDSLDETLFRINGSTKMQIKSSGNVGIGNNSPDAKLDVNGAIYADGLISSFSGSNQGYFGMVSSENRLLNLATSGTTLIQSNSTITLNVVASNPMVFKTTNTEKMRITSSSNPTLQLGVSGTGTSIFEMKSAGGGSSVIDVEQFLQIKTSGSEKLRIDSSGRVGINETSLSGNDAKLIIDSGDGKHPAIKANDGGANGFTMLADNYTATESQFNIGVGYSGGQGVISQNCKVSDTANNVFLSSNAQGATKPMALSFDAGDFIFRNTNTSATTAVDTAVTLTDRMVIHSDGQVEFKKGAAQIKITDTDDSKFAEISYSSSFLSIRNNSTSSTHFVLNESGNIGIGTTSPSRKLQVAGDLRVDGLSSGTSVSFGGTGDFAIDAPGVDGGRFIVKHSSGNVGIGTNSPVQPLQVNGQVLFRTTTADGGKNRFQLIPGGSSDAANLYLYYGNSGDGTLSVRINAQGNSYFNGGNVGIGTTSPTGKLNVEAAGNHLHLRANTATAGKYWNFDITANNQLFIINNGGTGINIKDNGRVGIGNTSPAGQLDILTSNETMIKLRNSEATSGKDRDFKLDDNNKFEILDNNGTGVSLSQGSGSWSSESDERLKENIIELDNVLENINNLRAVKYNYKNGNDTKIGFIAQDWQKDFSEVIEEGEHLSMKYTETIPVLLKAIQELKKEIEILKNK